MTSAVASPPSTGSPSLRDGIIGFRKMFKDAPAYNVFTYSLVDCFSGKPKEYIETAVKLFHAADNQKIARNIFEVCGDYPASRYDHHQGVRGLLYHTLHCMEKHLCKTLLTPPHPSLDRTLLAVAGHDIGKPDVFDGKTRDSHQIRSAYLLRRMGVRDTEVLEQVATHHSSSGAMRRKLNLVTQADAESVKEWREIVTSSAVLAATAALFRRRSRFMHRYTYLHETYNLVDPYKFLYALRYILQRSSTYTSLASFFNILSSADPAAGHPLFDVCRLIRQILHPLVHPRLPSWQYQVVAYVDGKPLKVMPLKSVLVEPYEPCGIPVPVKSLRIEWSKFGSSKGPSIGDVGDGSGNAQAAQVLPEEKLPAGSSMKDEKRNGSGKDQKAVDPSRKDDQRRTHAETANRADVRRQRQERLVRTASQPDGGERSFG